MLTMALSGSEATADRIKSLSKRLSTSKSYKVRVSAALSLAKSDDLRAMRALTQALLRDQAATVRRVAATTLGRKLKGLRKSRKTKVQRKAALEALNRAASKDRDGNVRSSARLALSGLRTPKVTTARRSRGILVSVKVPTRTSARLPRQTGRLMQSAVKRIIRDRAPAHVKTAPGTGRPSNAQLKRSGLTGYSITPKISKLKLRRRGGRRVEVACEVNMRLTPWGSRDGDRLVLEKSAIVTGSGKVTSGDSKSAVATSSQTCITAVVEQVTASQVVPFLASRAQ